MNLTENQIQEQRPLTIKELQAKAHEFSNSILPDVLSSVTSLVIEYNIKIIEERRVDMKSQNKDTAEDEEEFRKFQNVLMGNACQNVRSITLQIVGGLTGDHFPELVEAQRQQNGQGDQAPVQQTTPRGEPVFIESQEVVGKPEVRVS